MTLDDLGKLEEEEEEDSKLVHDYNRFESQLCVPQDPIDDLEWYPTLADYSINLDDLSCSCKPMLDQDDQRNGALPRKKRNDVRRRCSHCLTERTPQWRAGPEGPKTLCNACGVRYKSGRLEPEYRPAASPTFDRARHSNFHKKILKRRRVN